MNYVIIYILGCSIFLDIMGTPHPQMMKNYSYSHKRIHKIKYPQNYEKTWESMIIIEPIEFNTCSFQNL